MSRAQASELGEELRWYREAARLSGRELADRLGLSVSTVSRMENGLTPISEIDVVRYGAHCGMDAHRIDEILDLCRDPGAPGYWMTKRLSTLVFHENAANSSASYDPMVVPGLLQTERYAADLIGAERLDPVVARHRVGARMERQRTLHDRSFTFFIHEQALRLPVGGARVMNEQLLKLALLAEQTHLAIRVVPSALGAYSVFAGSFLLFHYRGHAPLIFIPAADLYLEGPDHVAKYQDRLTRLSRVALGRRESREWLARLASEFDQPEDSPDATSNLAKEQLQRGI